MSTSPLTALPSSSSPASFYTPVGGSPATAGDCTNLSTPATEPASSPYRDARPLPRELKEHCQIFFEEQMCMFYHERAVLFYTLLLGHIL